MELIKVKNENGKQLVSARELYEFLGLDKTHWKRWSDKNIVDDDLFKEKEEWTGLAIMANGNETKDYIITIDMAKELSMLTRTEKGKEARKYFIDCEKKLMQNIIPRNYGEALLEAGRLALELENANAKILENKPKIDFYEAVTESKDTIDMGTVAKVLNFKSVGRNKLFEILRDEKVLMQNNQPFQKYIDLEWFRQVESKFNMPNGDVKINIKTVVFQKGLEGIRKVLKKQMVQL